MVCPVGISILAASKFPKVTFSSENANGILLSQNPLIDLPFL